MSEILMQAGEGSIEGSVDEKIGVIAIRAIAYAPDLVTALSAQPGDIGISLPMVLRNFRRRAEGAGYDVIFNFEGHLTPDEADGEDFSMDGSTSEDKIETHINFLGLLALYGGGKKPNAATGEMVWPLMIAGASGGPAVKNPLHGVDSYLVPGLIWNRKSVSRNFPATLLAGLGSIDTPPGNPPGVTGQRNWLKIRARATFRGNVWQIEESWQLSGPDGWNVDIYKYR